MVMQAIGLAKSFGKKAIFNDINFSIEKGKAAVIRGKSGAGKSTLINICGLLSNPDKGQLFYEGKSIDFRNEKTKQYIRANKIGYVFQAYHLIESLTVQENVEMAFMYADQKINNDSVKNMLSLMEEIGIYELRNNRVKDLSGGEKQRVAIARAMVKKPILLIADEPTGNLDNENKLIIINTFNKLLESGASVITVTHDDSFELLNGDSYTLEEGMLVKC